jgi:5'-3' exonuclease
VAFGEPDGVRVKILTVDLSHVFWTLALGGQLANPNAPRDMAVAQIRELAKSYDRVAIAVDGKAKSFRANLWPGYKAKRSQRPDELWSLLEDTVRHCAAHPWHVFRAPEHPDGGSYEADDVVATIVGWAREHEAACDILSGDSDLTQLVDDDLCIRMLRRYKGELKVLDCEAVKAWCKVPPSSIVDIKALAGDTGDGYGDLFPGVGPAGALTALLEYTSATAAVEAAVAAVAAGDTSSIKTKLAAGGIERVNIGYRLARVVPNVPIDVGSLAREAVPVELAEIGAELVDDNAAPPSDPAPMSPGRAAVDQGAGPLLPRDIDTAMVHADPSMRMLAPAQEAFNRLIEFRAFVRRCMVRGVDYGRIPGVDKECLFKPGAEKLVEIYGLVARFEIEKELEDWERETPFFFYRVRCRIVRKRDGMQTAECIGSCNSRETKYAGRWAKETQVPPHLDITRLKRREFVARQGQDKGQTIVQFRVPNEEICDQVNTIVKMAQKRAMVGGIIIATRSGGVFTQDAEDIPAAAFGAAYEEKQWQS